MRLERQEIDSDPNSTLFLNPISHPTISFHPAPIIGFSPGSPIAWLAAVVCHGDHFDFCSREAIYKAEGKAWKDIAARMAGDSRPALRRCLNLGRCVFQF